MHYSPPIIMFSLILRTCIISVILNASIVKLNTTELTSITEERYHELDLLDWDAFCKFQPNGHTCEDGEVGRPMYYYDVKLGDCKTFHFGGCRESKNYFNRLKVCQLTCEEAGPKAVNHTFAPNVFCRFQPDSGTCDAYIPMFYFDLTVRKCVGFAFSGCGGNQNRFTKQSDCTRTCAPAVSYKQQSTWVPPSELNFSYKQPYSDLETLAQDRSKWKCAQRALSLQEREKNNDYHIKRKRASCSPDGKQSPPPLDTATPKES